MTICNKKKIKGLTCYNNMSNVICTTILSQILNNILFLFSHLLKTIEREKRRESKNTRV
jgi:hypothetical protein